MREQGFTAIELMIGVVLAAILLALAAPSFTSTIERNQLSSNINELIATLQYARSESIRRSQRITLCRSDDATNCGATGYEEGWIVFVDNVTPNGSLEVGEPVLKVFQGLDGSMTMRGDASFANFVSYLPTGGLANANAGRFVLCKYNDLTKSRAVFITRAGRARLARDTDNDKIPEDDSGNDITSCT